MQFDLIKEVLLASGVKEDQGFAAYVDKLDHLYRQFIQDMDPIDDLLTTAKALFDWLWIKKPDRYRLHGYYRLSDAIDSQLSKDSQAVGNCLGLTLLYNCLLRTAGIGAGALHLENAFGRGPHVLSILKTKESMIEIENILPKGFNYKGHLEDSSRVIWGDRELVADIYLSQGNECYERGDYRGALKRYKQAIDLNPRYERARLNKVIVLDRMGMENEKNEI
jgi:tetratricopeptide (TPR) repeat protein